MQQVEVKRAREGADPEAFRDEIKTGWTGDARPRPQDCTGCRYLVREEALDAFKRLASRYGLHVHRDARYGVR